jgi:hypothetical protein
MTTTEELLRKLRSHPDVIGVTVQNPAQNEAEAGFAEWSIDVQIVRDRRFEGMNASLEELLAAAIQKITGEAGLEKTVQAFEEAGEPVEAFRKGVTAPLPQTESNDYIDMVKVFQRRGDNRRDFEGLASPYYTKGVLDYLEAHRQGREAKFGYIDDESWVVVRTLIAHFVYENQDERGYFVPLQDVDQIVKFLGAMLLETRYFMKAPEE